jgi:hypothetical protein
MSGSGLDLHDALKERFGFDRGIVRSYRLTHGEVPVRAPQTDDIVEELLVELGDETTTTVGTGRSWVIDVERRTHDGLLLSMERWSMFGYPSDSLRAQRDTSTMQHPPATDPSAIFGSFAVTAQFVRSSATDNGVEVAVHHDSDAARAAGARDIFLDTATQVALFSAQAIELLGQDRRVASVELKMRSPICAGDTLGFVVDGQVEPGTSGDGPLELHLRAVVDGVTASSAVVAFHP